MTLYDFAMLDFPDFMASLSRYQRVQPSLTEIRMSDMVSIFSPANVSDTHFEYASSVLYVTFDITETGMHLVMVDKNEGITVLDEVFTDFLEIKEAVRRYS